MIFTKRAKRSLFVPQKTSQVDVLADTDFLEGISQIEGPDVAVIFDQEEVVKLVHIVVGDVLEHVEWLEDLPRVREANDAGQVDFRRVDAVVEEHDFVYKVRRRLVDGHTPSINTTCARHHPHENLLSKT